MFSVARSRFTLLSQAIFFILNAVGLFLGTVYNTNTPDLYENNAHHKMGWIFTWVAAAWVVMGVINVYAGRMAGRRDSGQQMSTANMAQYQRLQNEEESQVRRWSDDSGQGTERNSTSLFGSTNSPGIENNRFDESLPVYNGGGIDEATVEPEKRGFLSNTRVDRFLSNNIHRIAFGKTLAINKVLYIFLERLIILMGFFALTTGVVTFGGLFVSHPNSPLLLN
jgi:hypothetical protein